MEPKQAQAQLKVYAKAHGISVGDAYYRVQEMCEEHRDVWDFGRAAGIDEVAEHLDSIGGEWAERAVEEVREFAARAMAPAKEEPAG